VEEEHHYSATPSRGFDPEEVKRRIQEQAKRKEEKLEALRKEKEAKELEGCTFAPKVKATAARDLNKFLEDQKRFVEMKEQKQQERRERQLANEQSQVVPVGVNAKSRKILEERQRKGEPLSPNKASETMKQPFLQKNASRASVNKVVEGARRPSTVSAMA